MVKKRQNRGKHCNVGLVWFLGSLVPNVFRAWHVYGRDKKCLCRLSYTPVRRQENLATSCDRTSVFSRQIGKNINKSYH